MNHTTTSSPLEQGLRSLPSSAPAAARTVLRMLSHLRHGQLDLQLPDGHTARFGTPEGPRAAMRLHNWKVCAQALKSGDIGFAESFIAGDWTSPDLTALIRLFIANRQDIESVIYGHWWGRLLYRWRHLLQRNSRRGSRRNIHAHYDLGNEFYRLWLDPGMTYSSGWFEGRHDRSLSEAQDAKIRRALRECGLRPGHRLLEIGCGWGGLAEVAAADFGAQVTGVTLSTEQLAYARARLDALGLSAQADLRLQDYRDIDDAPFDAICSIEMFEAVGREYWPAYFATVARLLKPGAHACIQSITIRDDLFERYVRGTDFIQQYIFPGGLLPSPSQFRAQASQAGLEVVNELAFGADYAETLRRWRERFLAEETRVRRLGFDTRFMRTWEFYLAYCEAAFAMGNTDVIQFTLRKP
ncbi:MULTISPECIES: cyclopropane-fatty-acyl-phospholipid synthase family protein [Caldimonas]|uniref:SAM-dependent methyltransferase n=1 Tax=Caldimonas TaxID=196013 RepID=UPI000375A13F|nr:cyclopropane-fatty-acyl-phospholipid synthase family protein [Caldimonas manganoxidans]